MLVDTSDMRSTGDSLARTKHSSEDEKKIRLALESFGWSTEGQCTTSVGHVEKIVTDDKEFSTGP